MRQLLVSCLVAATISAEALQSPDTAAPTFEVASVKPNRTGAPGGSFVLPPGRFTATNIPLKVLITNAYQLSFFQVVGGPDWVSTDRFDIVATAPVTAPVSQTRAMVRTLLEDRFKLVVHMETRDTPIYALVKAQAGEQLGPNLKRSTGDCGALRAERAAATAAAARASGGRAAVPSPPPVSDPVVCGMRRISRSDSATIGYRAGNITMAALANALRPYVGREVVDRSGLAGEFDFDLSFSPPTTAGADAGAGGAPLDEAASVFTALREQLGLKLESTLGPVELLVIDSAERPSEN